VLHQPRKQKGGLLLSLCTADGLAAEWIAKARGASHRRARKLSWGDAVEAEDELRGP
jgi:ribosomal protein RSM22 (predicted rRNA methylase)